VIVEFVKREQQHIQGTSYTWIHTERDYSNQWCYPLAIISYRDQNAPPPPAPKKKHSREEDTIKRERSRDRSRSPGDRRRDRSRDRDRYQRDRRDRSRERDRHRERDDYRIKRERRDDDYRDSSSRREDEYRRRDRDRDGSRKENRDDDRRGSVPSSVDQRWPGDDRYEATPKYDRRSSSFGQDMNSSYNSQHSGDGLQGQNGFDGHNHNRVPPSNGNYHGSNHHHPGGPSGMRPNHRMPIRPSYNGQNSYSHGNPRFNNMRMPHGNGYQMPNQRGQPRQPFDRSMSTPNPHVSPDRIPHPENFPENFSQRGHRGPPNEGMTPNRGRFPSTGYQNSPGFQGSPHISPPGRPDQARRNSEQANTHKTPSTAQSLLTHSPGPPLGTPLQTQGRKDHFCREYIKERLENMRSSRVRFFPFYPNLIFAFQKAITFWSGKLAFGDDNLDASLMQYTDPHALYISESLLHFSKLKSVLFNDLRSEIQKLNLTVVKERVYKFLKQKTLKNKINPITAKKIYAQKFCWNMVVLSGVYKK